MIVRRGYIVFRLWNKWRYLKDGLPNPTNIAMPDREYYLPHFAEVKNLLRADIWTDRRIYLPEVHDCDDFAHELYCASRRLVYGEVLADLYELKDARPWALGIVWGTKFRGRKCGHAINLVLTHDKGFQFIEPQNDEMWQGKPENNQFHFLLM